MNKRKALSIAIILLSLSLAFPDFAEARLGDKFNRFSSLKKLSRFTDFGSSFKKLANSKTKVGSLSHSFQKLVNLSTHFSRSLQPSFARIATLKSMNENLKISFTKMAVIQTNFSGTLKPSFSKLGNIRTDLAGGLKPSFAKLSQTKTNMIRGLKPSFIKLATISAHMAGAIKPSFVKLATINANFATSLKPSLAKLATVNFDIAEVFKPEFKRLAKINPKMVAVINPSLAKLALQPRPSLNLESSRLPTTKSQLQLLGQPIGIPKIPLRLRDITMIPKQRVALIQFFGGPAAFYPLSVNPTQLRQASPQEAAEILQRDLHLIQPEETTFATGNLQLGPQNVSLRSLLAVEAK